MSVEGLIDEKIVSVGSLRDVLKELARKYSISHQDMKRLVEAIEEYVEEIEEYDAILWDEEEWEI